MEEEGLRTLLFQVIRELLFNVVKHADVEHATVELNRDEDQIVIRVYHHGTGFDAEEVMRKAKSSQGTGLFNVRERLNFVGGRLEIDSAPGKGTRIVVYVRYVKA